MLTKDWRFRVLLTASGVEKRDPWVRVLEMAPERRGLHSLTARPCGVCGGDHKISGFLAGQRCFHKTSVRFASAG
ncbi:hypothetical protein GCM10023148_19430 [Actinokineospora soli]